MSKLGAWPYPALHVARMGHSDAGRDLLFQELVSDGPPARAGLELLVQALNTHYDRVALEVAGLQPFRPRTGNRPNS